MFQKSTQFASCKKADQTFAGFGVPEFAEPFNSAVDFKTCNRSFADFLTPNGNNFTVFTQLSSEGTQVFLLFSTVLAVTDIDGAIGG